MPDSCRTNNRAALDSKSQIGMFFAEEMPKKEVPKKEATAIKFDPETVDLVSSQNERYINMVGAFLVDNFWLGSMHHNVNGDISDTARRSLVIEQSADLQEKYGEQMGLRTLDGQILSALDAETKDMLGVATLKSTLLMGESVMESERAESIAKNTVAALSPKLRREYKNASIQKIADELLAEQDTQAIALVSNLAVASSARGRGIAKYICGEVEDLAKSWGFSDIWLIVESENTAARSLYEGKLGYKVAFEIENDGALRADPATGEFVEVQVDSVVMKKSI